ncbi:uncharacterized protein PV09_08785 [Verruconis gallopava]|uniref:Cryptic loci regulator 2 N-terminal domain-containing protein n=1 Tax=Verruconis gallopava TaxID=253628 RepID=A0A0D1XBN6_9PEZI|nr:uncharacterized protein PV09_08785 [Verruconis gallopava]KIV99610.1 hypothetical protein PV09_08785 [Verruconis gallopava]
MTLFNVIYCRRSDGKLETEGKNRVREKNEPTKEQLDSTPNEKGVSDYYRPLTMHDAKHLDWRRKLAGMLVKELGGKDFSYADGAYILDDLPENYRLFEHVKSKPTDGDAKPGKTHAGGGHDRQDAYLYGHPGGRKKRFRSPGDFFPHLLWLCTDEAGDPMNCTCKLCSPDELQTDVKSGPAKGGTVSMKVESQKAEQAVNKMPAVEIPARSTAQQLAPATAHSKPATQSITAPAASPPRQQATPQQNPQQRVSQPHAPQQQAPQPQAPQRQLEVATLPTPKDIDQQIDTTYGQFSFRLGELVWFNRGAAWALGVVIRRWMLRNMPPHHSRRYVIQPLSAPFLPQNTVIIEIETAMRPWLAWSPPIFCHQGLNQGPQPTFSTVDWNAVVSGRYGPSNDEIVIVDASIMAARAIDSTYTPFGYLKSSPITQVQSDAQPHYTTHQMFWNGVYIGGERVWVGDPVRLRASNSEDVLVISQIIERPLQFISTQPTAPTKVLLTGNVISCSTLPSDAVTPDRQHLVPQRMREDLEARNKAIQAIGGPKSFWKILQYGQVVDVADVKGRWYETSIMAPIVNQQPNYSDCVRDGQTDSVARSFNGRIDVNRTAGIRHDKRESAFGRAVPEGLRLIEGTEPPTPAMEIAPRTEPPQQQQQLPPQSQPHVHHMPMQTEFDTQMSGNDQADGLDQFIDLGEEETESMTAFGQPYGSQGSYFH